VIESGSRARRRIKVRGGNLGAFLCWAVVFADIGTSIYYVPEILHDRFGTRSAIFVLMTLFVFILLCAKYAEVTWRYPEGGGVVNVSSQALHPFVGMLGGMFILVDYYLTAGISALSGVLYISVLAPGLLPLATSLTVAALIGLGLLNSLGIKESAGATAVIACVAGVGQLVVVAVVAINLGPAGIMQSLKLPLSGMPLSTGSIVTGYAAAFLAFSGLESIAQLAPSMREPRRVVAYRAMGAVVMTLAVTSPLLTLWQTTLLPKSAPSGQFLSVLGAQFAGSSVGDYVALSGAMLLVFASNTAIIGAYHVFIALARMGFMPRVMEKRNRWRKTPHFAILAAIVLPVLIVVAAQGSLDFLGDLYAFGLLGTFVLTCVSLDVVRWRERRKWKTGSVILYAIGVITTVLVLIAWVVNLYAKPKATGFGGGLTLLGLIVGLATYRYYRRRQPAVFPVPFRPQRAAESIVSALGGRRLAGDVLVILPHEQLAAEAVVSEAARAAAGRGVVFLYRGTRHGREQADLFEVTDPWFKDYAARDAFARAEMMSRKLIPHRRFVYVPSSLPREMVGEVWRTIHPKETVVMLEDKDMLPPAAVDRVRRHTTEGHTVLHMFTSHVAPLPEAITA